MVSNNQNPIPPKPTDLGGGVYTRFLINEGYNLARKKKLCEAHSFISI